MLKFIKFFRGYLYVHITRYSPERFFNLCAGRNIVLWGIEPKEDGYHFFISRQAFHLIAAALDKTGTQITVLRKIGLPYLVRKYRKHGCFLIGILCAVFLLFFMSLFIWKVEVDGNSYYSTQTILEFLEENGVGYASLKAGINCKELQNKLRKEFEDITWVSAKMEGTRLYIVVQERLKGSTEDNMDEENENALDLVASNAGTVESIVVRQGTPLVTAGDIVEAGDVLVSGAIAILDDSGETASYRFVQSDADVLIRTTLSYSDTFSQSYERKNLTGEKKYGITLYFNEYEWNLCKMPADSNYLEITRVNPVVVGTDFYFPFQIEKKIYLEYESVTTEYSEAEIETLAQNHLNLYCKNLEENGVQILSNSVMIEPNGNCILVSGTLEVLEKQSDYQTTTSERMEE